MKIRLGFVSNSSSTSFCIWGVNIGSTRPENDDELEKLGLEIHFGAYDDVYVGRSFDTIKDDETGKQFKDSVKSALESAKIDTSSIGEYGESYYNG